MKRFFLAAVVSSLLFVNTAAHADRIYPGGNSSGSVTVIGAGVKELSLETQIVFNSTTSKNKEPAPSTTNSNLALMGAGIFRYFVIDNLSIGLHVGGFFKKAGTKTGDSEASANDAGFIGTVTAAYYLSVGGGMFISPTVGAGFFAGSRELRSPPIQGQTGDNVLRYSISGPVVRAGLGLVFYSSARFNLFARPEAIIYLGSAKQKAEGNIVVDPEAKKFTTIDGGFTCGLSYVF
jgi:hypothetical protein